jgi:uncharacterized protein (TIGR02246 family)
MGDLERLVAIEAIKQVKARYYRFLDTHDWDAFEGVFTEDAVLNVQVETRILQSEEGIYRGRATIRAFAEKAIAGAITIDHALLPEIEILSEDTATAIWAQEDRVFWPDGGPNKQLHGHGYDYETYRRVDGKWLIASTKLVRLRTDMQRA